MKTLKLSIVLIIISLNTFAGIKGHSQLVIGVHMDKANEYPIMFKYVRSKGFKHFIKVDYVNNIAMYYFSK